MKLKSYIQLATLGAAVLISACNNADEKKADNSSNNSKKGTEETKVNAPEVKGPKTKQDSLQALSKKELTSEAGLTSEEIDALYNDPVIDANGKERPINSITAFEYLRYDDDTELFSAYVERYTEARRHLEEKDNVVLFVPTDGYLESTGNQGALMEMWDAKDQEAMHNVLISHVQKLEGKYIGGDFISISDLAKGKITQVKKRRNKWFYKAPIVSDPILVSNGIIFKIDGAYLPPEYSK